LPFDAWDKADLTKTQLWENKMTSNNDERNRGYSRTDDDGNERDKGESGQGRKNEQSQGEYGGSDFGRADNGNEDWQAGATEYDMNYRGQGFSSSSQSDPEGDGASLEADRHRNRGRETSSMGVEQDSQAGKEPNTDELIYEEIYMLLEHQPDIDTNDVQLTVKNGEVTLEGSVRERLTKRRLDEGIELIAGVHAVHNRVRVEEDNPSMEGREYGTDARGKSGMSDQTSSDSQSDYQGQGTGRAKNQNP
jgi:osmotically-inducible protein OsmY